MGFWRIFLIVLVFTMLLNSVFALSLELIDELVDSPTGEGKAIKIVTDMPAKCFVEVDEDLSNMHSEDNLTFTYDIEEKNGNITGYCEAINNTGDIKGFSIEIKLKNESNSYDIEKKGKENDNLPFLITYISPKDSSPIYLSDYIEAHTNKNATCHIKTTDNSYVMEGLQDNTHRIKVSNITQKKGKTNFVIACFNKQHGRETKAVTYFVGGEGIEDANSPSGGYPSRISMLPLTKIIDFFNENLALLLVLVISLALNITGIILLVVVLKRNKSDAKKDEPRLESLNSQIFFPSQKAPSNRRGRFKPTKSAHRPRRSNGPKPRINLEPFEEFQEKPEAADKKDQEAFRHLDLSKYLEKKEEWLDISDILNEKKEEKKESKKLDNKEEEDPVEKLEKQIYLESLKGKTNLQLIVEALKENYKDSPNPDLITWAINKLINQKQINIKQAGNVINQLKSDKVIDDMQALQMLGKLNLI